MSNNFSGARSHGAPQDTEMDVAWQELMAITELQVTLQHWLCKRKLILFIFICKLILLRVFSQKCYHNILLCYQAEAVDLNKLLNWIGLINKCILFSRVANCWKTNTQLRKATMAHLNDGRMKRLWEGASAACCSRPPAPHNSHLFPGETWSHLWEPIGYGWHVGEGANCRDTDEMWKIHSSTN